MQIKVATVQEYLDALPEDRKAVINQLRKSILKTLPEGFVEVMSYGMIGYVVPHELYPPGYHCNTSLPLPFINIASQKNFFAIYHMGIYSNADLMNWFNEEYAKRIKTKLDKGKSCFRFKKPEQIPFDLIETLVSKISVNDWIKIYESEIKSKSGI